MSSASSFDEDELSAATLARAERWNTRPSPSPRPPRLPEAEPATDAPDPATKGTMPPAGSGEPATLRAPPLRRVLAELDRPEPPQALEPRLVSLAAAAGNGDALSAPEEPREWPRPGGGVPRELRPRPLCTCRDTGGLGDRVWRSKNALGGALAAAECRGGRCKATPGVGARTAKARPGDRPLPPLTAPLLPVAGPLLLLVPLTLPEEAAEALPPIAPQPAWP